MNISFKKTLFLIIIVIFVEMLNVSYSQEWQEGNFIKTDDELKYNQKYNYINLSDEVDFWHYSGGYWQTNYYNNSLRIYDSDLSNYMNIDKKSFQISPVTLTINIPEELNKYYNTVNNVDLEFSLESDYLKSNIRPLEIFDYGSIKYKIANNKILIRYSPIFNIDTKSQLNLKTGELNVAIPMIKSKFGFPLFSIWNKDGTSLGNTNIGNIADLPEDHAFLDGRNPVISIDTSSDIINPQGDLVNKDIGIWNTIPNKYTITEKSTNDYRIGVGTFANGGAAGMKFILPLRMYYPVLEEGIEDDESIEDNDIVNDHSEGFEGSGVIKAMTPNKNQYDVSLGIPSSEYLYTQVIGKKRLTNYEFEKVTGNKDFSVTVKRKYTERWKIIDEENSTEENTVYITKRRRRTISKNYLINREYSYYKINSFENYGIDSAIVTSEILPSGQVILSPNNYSLPEIDLKDEENIVTEPLVDSVITLSPKTVGKNNTPSSPNWYSIADNAVGSYQVRNDSLVFDSNVIMNSSVSEKNTPIPKEISEADFIGDEVLKKENMKIEESKRNSNYSSSGKIIYKKFYDFNGPSPNEIIKDISVNSVDVHTPIYSELLISNIGDSYNQQVNADIDDRAMILGMPTKFRYSTTGNHRNILGFGNRDYDDYIAIKEIKFPFDIYYDTTYPEPSKFLKRDTWIRVNTLDTDIYLPIWVNEGSYQISIRSRAINGTKSDIIKASLKNTDEQYYIVEDEKTVEVIGRLYGFKVRDINDYPTWEEVFRTKKGSYDFIEGNNYPYGGNDENGNVLRNNRKYFLPITAGSHPVYKNIGNIPLGYKIRFTIETIGNYLEDDKIILIPKFSLIDKFGNEDKAIKLWSKITINNNEYLVELNAMDSSLKDKIPYAINLGDPYITLKEEELQSISDYLKISSFNLKKKQEIIGFADQINLTKFLRTYIGGLTNPPADINYNDIQKARQKWYGEYWLPNDTYVLKDNMDLVTYAVENNGVDFSEDIFIKDGFIKVNFEISSFKAQESSGKNLIYKNALANMYNIEGFQHKKEVYINGENRLFDFDDGDTILYDVNKRKSDDYSNYGTH